MDYQERSIQAKVRLTEEEYREISMIYPKFIRKTRKKKFIVYVAIAVIVFLIIGAVTQYLSAPVSTTEPVMPTENSLNERIFSLLLPTSFIILYVVLKILKPVLIKKSVRKEFSSNKLVQREVGYNLTLDSVEITSTDFYLKLRYEDIYQALVTNKYIVLFESERIIRIIPKRSFENEETVTAALRLLEENLPKGKYVIY
ncbi:YcxB family protein [Anaerocolumna xylanovorans]|uniref:YcxB-like protein n=1 Tax=Anaerocolumna xylanovorans DSM 12503 TaxID=1121345 RepID=A0A1M7Y1G0_9FIRM|nr:YcxB family protein [Anaerocolumna xylanovorans]SHO45618.1 YcxB-like protein [Anaerocolumna xylanovorans DSM 12503]